jgi:Tol biopolymer transport system component
MSERTKKILFAIFFIAFSIGMGYVLYIILFPTRPPVTVEPTPTGPGGTLPSSGTGVSGVTATPTTPGVLPPSETVPSAQVPPAPVTTHLLRDGVTQAVSRSPDGNGARFYNPDDGRFYRVNTDGTVTVLGEKQFFNVDTVNWANANDEVIVEFPDGSNVFYDFVEQKQVTLPAHWEGFDFSPDDRQITAKSMGVDPNNRFLITSNPNGTEAKPIEPLGENSALVHPSWSPQNQIIAYTETGEPQSDNNQQIYFVGRNRENFNALIAPGQDFLPNWSPNGKQILFSVWNLSSNDKPNLWITSGEASNIGQNRKNLNLQTWADKCSWAGETDLYCGVPQGLPDNAGLQREDFVTYPDDIYHINLQSGTVSKINTPDQNHPVQNPIVSRDGSKFLFTDAQNGKLYSYDLR